MHVLLCRNDGSDRYPRWGYLEKFAQNQYMARAVVGAILIQAFGLGAYALRGVSNQMRHVPTETVSGPVNPLPPPSWEKPPSGGPGVKPTQYVVPARPAVPKPVPVPDTDPLWADVVDWHPGGGGTGSASVPGPDYGGAWGPIEWSPATPLPKPTDFVAFESAPELITMDSPTYPDIAREAGVDGSVRVLVLVGVDGFVVEALIAGDGVPMLNDSALRAARTAVFRPALQSDQPVAVWIAIPIDFALRH